MLKDPFPSSGKSSWDCLYYQRGEDGDTRTQPVAAPYAARKFIEAILGDEEFKLDSPKTLESTSGIRVRAHKLRQIMTHEYTDEEKAWELPHPYSRDAYIFRHGKPPEPVNDLEERARIIRERATANAEKRPAATRKRPAGDVVTIGEIAVELKMLPREARAILRREKEPKPEGGWAWSKANDIEISRIKALLEKGKKA